MKIKFNVYFFIGLVIVISGCVSLDNTKDLSSTSVANVDKKIVPVNQFYTLLEMTMKKIKEDDRFDNFILFVHGRGKHPQKAYDKSLISDLESNYSAKVIMFHWPSWEGPLEFPEGKARKSADDFTLVLKQLKKYQEDNPKLLDKTKFTLLTHSMGSIVLEETIYKYGSQLKGIFDTIVISASASSSKNHADWVTNIGLSDKIYITVNKDDPMLGPAGTKMKGRRLGKGLQNRDGDIFELAQNAKYIDLTKSSLEHRYYIHRDLENRPVAKSFFDEVLNGLPASFNQGNAVKEIKRSRIYILKRHL